MSTDPWSYFTGRLKLLSSKLFSSGQCCYSLLYVFYRGDCKDNILIQFINTYRQWYINIFMNNNIWVIWCHIYTYLIIFATNQFVNEALKYSQH